MTSSTDTISSSDSNPSFDLPVFLGVDVGGTNVKVGLVDDQGQLVAEDSFPTQQELGPSFAFDQTKKVVDRMLERVGLNWADVRAAGLGTPGPLDLKTGMILTPSNLPGWHQFPVRDTLAETLGVPVSFTNDANAAAFGEYWIGRGKEHESIVLITLGTGVGAGIIIDDFSIDGASSHGAELGHVVVDTSDQAERCSCGRMGHLEAYASATAVVARTTRRLADWPDSVLHEMMSEAAPLSALMIYTAATQNDALAIEMLDQTADYLARGITMMAHVIDPSAFFLGGAMNFGGSGTVMGDRFLNRLRKTVKNGCFPVLADNLVIEFAEMGGKAGWVGAAGIGRRDYHQNAAATTHSS